MTAGQRLAVRGSIIQAFSFNGKQAVEKDSECFESLSMNGKFSLILDLIRSS
jgi:hypothetical protein